MPDDREAIRATYAHYEATGRDRLWDRANRGYNRLSEDRDRAIVELVNTALPDGGGTLLDVGCGAGGTARLLAAAEVSARYSGIDLLPSLIDSAREAVADGEFLVGSADAMPFENDAFDVVLALTLFSSLPSVNMERTVAREIERVLRPGGWLIWYDLRYDNPWNDAVHGIARKRLAMLFPGWQAQVRSLTLLPPLARRLGVLTPVAYPVLHSLPPLRSHLIGRLRCPG